MSAKHRMTAWCPFGLNKDGLEVVIQFKYSPGRPAVMYLKNGDPGYPADPPEVDFVEANLVHHTIDTGMQKMLDEWAVEYLASDDGFLEAVEAAQEEDYAER